MSLVVQIVVGLILLVGFITIILAKKTLHWSQIVLVICIQLAGVGFLLLAAETVRTHHVLRAKIPQMERDLETANKQHDTLLHGSNNAPGVLELEHQLQMVSRKRGRVWRNVMPVGEVSNQGGIEVEISQPKPHGLAEGSIVYAFESSGGAAPAADNSSAEPAEVVEEEAPAEEAPADEAPAEADAGAAPVASGRKQYLGDFRVVAATEAGVSLEPVQLINQRTGQRLVESQGPWSLYETMPADRHSIFAGMAEEELRQMLPAESVEEFIRHGQEATADDNEFDRVGLDENDKPLPPENIDQAVKFLFDRPLRDYAFLFAHLAQERILLQSRIQAVTEDNAKLTQSIASAKKTGEFRQQQAVLLQEDLAGMRKDRQAIEAHRDMLSQMVANAQQQISRTLEQNLQQAQQLTQGQLNQLQLINSTAPAPAGVESLAP